MTRDSLAISILQEAVRKCRKYPPNLCEKRADSSVPCRSLRNHYNNYFLKSSSGWNKLRHRWRAPWRGLCHVQEKHKAELKKIHLSSKSSLALSLFSTSSSLPLFPRLLYNNMELPTSRTKTSSGKVGCVENKSCKHHE